MCTFGIRKLESPGPDWATVQKCFFDDGFGCSIRFNMMWRTDRQTDTSRQHVLYAVHTRRAVKKWDGIDYDASEDMSYIQTFTGRWKQAMTIEYSGIGAVSRPAEMSWGAITWVTQLEWKHGHSFAHCMAEQSATGVASPEFVGRGCTSWELYPHCRGKVLAQSPGKASHELKHSSIQFGDLPIQKSQIYSMV